MSNNLSNTPNWTIDFFILSKNSVWISKAREFYTNKDYAKSRMKELKECSNISQPHLRPFIFEADENHMQGNQRRRAEYERYRETTEQEEG